MIFALVHGAWKPSEVEGRGARGSCNCHAPCFLRLHKRHLKEHASCLIHSVACKKLFLSPVNNYREGCSEALPLSGGSRPLETRLEPGNASSGAKLGLNSSAIRLVATVQEVPAFYEYW